jgi:hypothetical protein
MAHCFDYTRVPVDSMQFAICLDSFIHLVCNTCSDQFILLVEVSIFYYC